MNYSFKIYIVFLLILTTGFNTVGNNQLDVSSIYFENISLRNKIPNSVIFHIEQDSMGFLWINSEDGLFRYNGEHYEIFRTILNNPNSITLNNAIDMKLDGEGNPWLLFDGDLNKINTQNGEITHFNQIRTQSGTIGLTNNTQFAITTQSDIFISSYSQGLLFLPKSDTLINNLFELKQKYPILSKNLGIITFREHNLFVEKENDGIYQLFLNENNNEILNVKKLAHLGKARLYCIHPHNDNIWVGTSEGLIYVNRMNGSVIDFRNHPRKNSILPHDEILSLFADSDGNLWIGTRQNGLYIVSTNGLLNGTENTNAFRYFPDNNDGSLTNRCINTIFMDKDQNIWLGTYSGGLLFADEQQKKIHSLKYNPGHPESISHPKVWGMTEDKSGNIWIGTDGGGIDVWHPQKGMIKHINKNNSNLSDNAILCATTDKNGQLWFGTYNGGINVINPTTGKIYNNYKLFDPADNIEITDIRTIYQSPYERIWVGTNWRGLYYFDPSKKSFHKVSQLGNYDIRAIHQYSKEDLWIGTLGNGLIKYNLVNGKRIIYNISSEKQNKISSNYINAITKDSQGLLWLGTDLGGLSCFNPNDESFKNYDSKNGLSNNKILSILEDKEGYLWISTNEGITRFDPHTETFINYDQTKGVLSGEFMNGSAISAIDGTFYFGCTSGLNYFKPLSIKPSKSLPKVVFTDLKLFNESVKTEDGIIDRKIEFSPKILLNHKQSVFTLEFQAIQYPFANKCKYSYKLEGYDKNWNYSEENNTATYRQLPAGNYQFKVKAANPDGIWSQQTSTINIEVIPPFWKTKFAYILYLVVFIVVTTLIFVMIINQLKTRNQLRYEQKIRQKEQKIHKERLEFFTNISHELRTPLTMIECAVDDLHIELNNSRNRKIKESIKTARFHSTRLLELIGQLLEFRRIETGNLKASFECIKLNDWLPAYLNNFKELADSKSITMKLSMPFNNIELWADPDKLSKIMSNLLSNALKFTPKKGIIEITAETSNNEIIITVTNTGQGISAKALPYIFDRYYKTDNRTTSTGIGLSLTKSLVEIHNGTITAESTPNKHTQFIIHFLKGNKHLNPEQLNLELRENSAQTDVIIQEHSTPKKRDSEKQILLIIEDNPEISSLLKDKFESKFDVTIAENGERGITFANQLVPDIIISDIMMPGIQGTDVCQLLKNQPETSHIPIILLTAKGTVEDELTGLNIGADDYISKPFNFKILEARVNSILENRIKLHHFFNNMQPEIEAGNQPNEREQLEHEFLEKTEKLILEKYLRSDSSVYELAEDLNFSRSSLYRKIKMLTGQSINEFIRSVKIKKAAELLATKDINVSEAAYKVGINDLKYFRENFVAQIGETPSAYKKRTTQG